MDNGTLDKNLRTFFGLSADEIVDRLPVRTLELLISKNSCPGRYQFSREVKAECCDRWPHLSDRWDMVKQNCNIHHKRPQCMGGVHNPENLIFIDVQIHNVIDRRVSDILTKGDKIIRASQPEGMQKKTKTLLDWMRADKSLKALKDSLSSVAGLSFNSEGNLMITIPYPEGRILIPQLLSRHEIGYPAEPCPLNVPSLKVA